MSAIEVDCPARGEVSGPSALDVDCPGTRPMQTLVVCLLLSGVVATDSGWYAEFSINFGLRV